MLIRTLAVFGYALFLSGGMHAARPQEHAVSRDLSCVKHLELPSYSFLARRSPNGGTVRALVSIGRNGKAKKIRTIASDENLADEVRGSLEAGSEYQAACSGSDVEIRFTFRLEGPAESHPPVMVQFEAPNHFILVSSPRKPTIN